MLRPTILQEHRKLHPLYNCTQMSHQQHSAWITSRSKDKRGLNCATECSLLWRNQWKPAGAVWCACAGTDRAEVRNLRELVFGLHVLATLLFGAARYRIHNGRSVEICGVYLATILMSSLSSAPFPDPNSYKWQVHSPGSCWQYQCTIHHLKNI